MDLDFYSVKCFGVKITNLKLVTLDIFLFYHAIYYFVYATKKLVEITKRLLLF